MLSILLNLIVVLLVLGLFMWIIRVVLELIGIAIPNNVLVIVFILLVLLVVFGHHGHYLHF